MIKRLFITIFIASVLAVAMVGCTKDTENDKQMSLSPTSVNLTAKGGADAIAVDCENDWIATSDSPWCILDKSEGSGFGTIEFHAAENKSNQIRTAIITVTSGEQAKTATIYQDASSFYIGRTELAFNYVATKDSVSVFSASKWSASTEQSWLHLTYNGDVTEKDTYLVISADENTQTEARQGVVTVTDGNTTLVISVSQVKYSSNNFIVTSTYSGYDAAKATMTSDIYGGTFEFTVVPPSNSIRWDATASYSGASAFLTLSNNLSQVGTQTFKVTVPFNDKGIRGAVIHIKGNLNNQIIDFPITLNQTYVTFDCTKDITTTGGDIDLKMSISPAMAVSYTIADSWLTVKDADKGILTCDQTDATRSTTVAISLKSAPSVQLAVVKVTEKTLYTITAPFQCNTYVTPLDPNSKTTPSIHNSIIENGGSTDINSGKMRSTTAWRTSYITSEPHQLSFYFRTEYTGLLELGIVCDIGSGSAVLDVEIEGVKHRITVSNTEMSTVYAGEYTISKKGYVRVNIIPISCTGSYLPYITDFKLGGSAINYTTKKSQGAITYVTPEEITAANGGHFIRRGPSCNIGWTQPSGDVEYFYNEIIVPVGEDIPGAYFMTTGGDSFYMGIQPNTKGSNRDVLFSVWDTNTASGLTAQLVRHGAGLAPNGFGHEGSGIQTFMYYDWEAGKTYATLIHVRPEVKSGSRTGSTLYTGYFWSEEKGWQLMAEVRRPSVISYYKGAHSFSENFRPEQGWITREVTFPNQWMRTTDGVWHEVLSASVNVDGTGGQGIRRDFCGGVNSDGIFYLKNIGYIDETTLPGTKFTRPSSGKSAPVIDFDALSQLGVADE